MTPNFALSLSFDGISLLQRAESGWVRVGDVALDAPDLSGALAKLRANAEALAPDGVACKLIIPNDQIKYLLLPGDPGDDAARRVQIRTALQGATPYAVSDLVYDWAVSAGQTQVAAVTRTTLDEALSFAVSHHFNPVSLVAIPPDGAFDGEVFFGAAPGVEGITRDVAAIRITGVAGTPQQDAAPVAEPVPEPEPAAEPEPEPEPEIAPSPAPVDPAMPVAASEERAEPAAAIAASEAQTPEPDLEETAPLPAFGSRRGKNDGDLQPVAEADLPETPPLAASEIAAPVDPTPDPAVAAAMPAFGSRRAPNGTSLKNGAALNGASAPDGPASVSARAAPLAEPKPEPKTEPKTEPGPSQHINGTGPDTPALPAALAGDPVPDPSSRFASVRAERGAAASPAPRLNGATRAAAQPGPLVPITARATGYDLPAPDPEAAASLERANGADTAREDSGSGFFSRRRKPRSQTAPSEVAQTPPPSVADAAAQTRSEQERMTIFGAREPQVIGGKPKYLGLALMALLLLFLAGVAAFASTYVSDGLARIFGPSEPEVTATELAKDDIPIAAPMPQTEIIELAALDAGIESDATDTALIEALNTPSQPLQTVPEMTPEEAAIHYALTGIWPVSPERPGEPVQGSLGDVVFAWLDPTVIQHDAIALPRSEDALTDAAMRLQPIPPGPSERFEFDARGLVLATPEGARTPEGYLVYLGRPALVPPGTPPRAASPEETIRAAQALAKLAAARPLARPSQLIENYERQLLGGRSQAELAAVRPKLRPPAPKEALEVDETATAQAVAQSLTPRARPRNFNRIVARARANPENAPETIEKTVRTVAQVTPKTVKPAAPSKASVTRSATIKNAIRLNRVNLMGVYGTQTNRRALVRLANGRYKKVKVGDRIDGGRISAIGEGQLRYTKNGRNIVLKLPKG